jgi:hypothetical protein
MKMTLFLFCLLCTTAAFAQHGGSVGSISSQPQIREVPSHTAHASYAPMGREQSVLSSSSFSFAHGDRPASDFPHPAMAAEAVSLGAVARELRQQHAQLKKSRVIWVNQ